MKGVAVTRKVLQIARVVRLLQPGGIELRGARIIKEPGDPAHGSVSRCGVIASRSIFPLRFGGKPSTDPLAIGLALEPVHIHDRHSFIAPTWIQCPARELRLWRHAAIGGGRETAVRRDGYLGSAEPKPTHARYLARRVLFRATVLIKFRAALLIIAGRNPNIQQSIFCILPEGAFAGDGRRLAPGPQNEGTGERQRCYIEHPRTPAKGQACACAIAIARDHLTAPTDDGCCAKYHATVRSRPSRNPVVARNPNSRSARDTSRHRRGWPFGCVVSHTIVPVNPTSPAIVSAVSRMVI